MDAKKKVELADEIEDMDLSVDDKDRTAFDKVLNAAIKKVDPRNELTIKDAVMKLSDKDIQNLMDDLSDFSYNESIVSDKIAEEIVNPTTAADKLLNIMTERSIKKVIRHGQLVNKVVCGPGMKAAGGKCVKMTAQEIKNRSIAARKSAKARKSRPKSAASKISRIKSLKIRQQKNL